MFDVKRDNGAPKTSDKKFSNQITRHRRFRDSRPCRAGLKQAFEIFWEATPGSHAIEDQVAEGDRVVTRLRARGVHEGDLPGISKTGNTLEMTATVIHRVENGKLAEKWSNKDDLGFMQQLEVIPRSEAHG